MTLQEFNQLANGAYKIAESNKLMAFGAPDWLSILTNIKDYPSVDLHRVMDDLLKESPDDKEVTEGDAEQIDEDVDDQFAKDVTPAPKDQRLKPDWINTHPDIPLKDLGLVNFDMLEGFLKEHGKEIKCLNLTNLDRNNELNDDQFEKLMQYCPKLNHLFIKSDKISNNALEHLKGMPLTSVNFSGCDKLTDKALEHLKGMPLTSVDFSWVRQSYRQGARASERHAADKR